MWLLAVVLMFSANVGFAQNDLIITGVFDGPLSGGTPKAIEIYVKNAVADLSKYGFGSANNGGGSDKAEFAFSGSANAGDFLYITATLTEFNTYFGLNATFESSAAGINGDDAIELFYNASGVTVGNAETVVDVFGDINKDGSGEAWDYLDGWAYRKNSTGPEGSTFTVGNWTYSGTNVNDGETSNSTATSKFPLGSYTAGAVAPSVTLTPTSLTGFSTPAGTVSASKSFTVSGSNLTGNLTVTAPTGFEVSLDDASFAGTQTLAVSGGSITGQPKTVYVRVATSATAGAKSEKVTISGGGLTANGEVTVSGTIAAAGTAVITNTGSFTAVTLGEGTTSASQSITVSGVNLTADITATAPTGFEVSLDNTTFNNSVTLTQTGGSISNVTVHIRAAASAAAGTPSGNVALTSTGATQVDVAVSATVVALSTIKSLREATDANGEPTATGTKRIKGLVYGVNLSGSDISITVIEGTNAANEGMNVYIRSSEFSKLGIANKDAFVAGDELDIIGTVSAYNGLMQLGSVINISKTGTGTVQTEATVTTLDENSESRLVKLENVIVTDPTEWTGSATNTSSFNVSISVGGSTFTLRVDGDTELAKKTYAEAFTGSATSGIIVVGIGGQFDNSDPRTEGYQILPWKVANISINVNAVVPNAPTVNAATDITTTGFTTNWTAATSGEAVTSYELDVATDDKFTTLVAGYNALSLTETTKAVTGLSSGTKYYIRVRAVGANGASANSNVAFATTSGTATGVNAATDVTFSTHPNPTQGTLVIESNAHKFAKVVVTNLTAKVMITKSLQGAQKSTIDLSNLSQGVYLVQIFDSRGNVLSVRRIVKR